jgi:hypothetical protein
METRRWLNILKRCDLASDSRLVELLQGEQQEEALAYLVTRQEENLQAIRDFAASHPREHRLHMMDKRWWEYEREFDFELEFDDHEGGAVHSGKRPRALTEEEEAEVDWYREELGHLHWEKRALKVAVSDARELVTGIPVPDPYDVGPRVHL